jgi:hypothetical protein
MSQESATQRYSAVLCRCCRQPIPLPAIVVSMAMARKDKQADAQDDPSNRVFSLRCRACDKEKPYRVTEVIDLEGSPRTRVRPRTKSALLRDRGDLTRSANA